MQHKPNFGAETLLRAFLKKNFKAMNATNINTGICHRRIQEGKPAYFVNYQQNGQQHYKFFALRFLAESFKNSLNS